MNKKGSIAQNLMRNAIYIIILAFFVVLVLLFLGTQKNGASVWADYYAKEIAQTINMANPGDEITLDVQKATDVAIDNKINLEQVFQFNKNQVCIKLDYNKISCYSYLNDVEVYDNKLQIGVPGNVLFFKVRGQSG
jgi:hypothetical protein